MQETPNFAKQKFLYRLSRSDYEKQWGKDYVKPGFGTRYFQYSCASCPKSVLLKDWHLTTQRRKTEDLYIKSINTTVDQYRVFLEQVGTNSLVLPNCDLDSGSLTKAAEYSLADESYAKLLGQLADNKFAQTSPELRANILSFYSDLSSPIETKKDKDDWKSVLSELDQLKTMTPIPTVAASNGQ